MNKKFYILTIGCQMNKSDSERLASFLESQGLVWTTKEDQANILIINACSVRQSAIDRVHGKIRKWQQWQKKNPKLLTILTGCILEADQKKFTRQFDLVVGIGEFDQITKIQKHSHPPSVPPSGRGGGSHSLLTSPSLLRPSGFGGQAGRGSDYFKVIPHYQSKFSALVPIMTGCNNFCSYCAVPYTRGRERSRSVKEVLKEIRDLARRGYLEVILLGQNVNSFSPKDKKSFSSKNPYQHPFAALLWEINNIKDLERIFFTAAHPKDMTEEVITALTLPKMVNYLHLPVQSGDNEILKKMNRHYTANDYLKLIKKIKKKKPNIALGTDIIVGFPGETKKQFQNTVKLYKEVEFDISYTARYSPRPGTVAAKLKDNVSRKEKKRRWQELQNLMEKITLKKNKKYQGQVVSVLIDKYKKGKGEGNSLEMKRVEFKSSRNFVGQIVDVKIKKALTWVLQGERISRN